MHTILIILFLYLLLTLQKSDLKLIALKVRQPLMLVIIVIMNNIQIKDVLTSGPMFPSSPGVPGFPGDPC